MSQADAGSGTGMMLQALEDTHIDPVISEPLKFTKDAERTADPRLEAVEKSYWPIAGFQAASDLIRIS